jgi:hypothetical protein
MGLSGTDGESLVGVMATWERKALSPNKPKQSNSHISFRESAEPNLWKIIIHSLLSIECDTLCKEWRFHSS